VPARGAARRQPAAPGDVRTGGLRLLRGARDLARQAAGLPESTARVITAFGPLISKFGGEAHIGEAEFSRDVDRIFEALYAHPLTEKTRTVTAYLRSRNFLPNEGSTESLIHYVVRESVARSPIPVPQAIVDEFWTFFHELMSDPELRGLADLGLDITRLILKTYEPLLVEVINELKDIYYSNQNRMDALLRRVQVVRGDLKIIRRQIKALRYIKPFFQADPKDYRAQAQIVAKMVREFGPFFIKMAQVAAATANFLPEEIARELAVFQEDVPPMSAQEARAALIESFGRPPEDIYFGFDAERPIKSGSIGSVYLAKKPFTVNGVEHLVPVIIKIGRHNLDREFLMGKTSIGLMLVSSQYWAPHGKLTPFLKAMTEQIDGFVEGFRGELQFEREAEVQAAFARRSRTSTVWRVPEVYRATPRVIEMEYVEGAVNISRAVQHFRPADPLAYRRELARKFPVHHPEPAVRLPGAARRPAPGQRHGGPRGPAAPDRLGQHGAAGRQGEAGARLPEGRAGGRCRPADRCADCHQHRARGRTSASRRDPRGAGAHAAEEADPPAVLQLRLDAVPRRPRRLAQARQYPAAACVEHPAARPGAARRIPAPVALTDGHDRHIGRPLRGRAALAGGC
jgi:ubiquinone biosynthesis protein